MTNSEALCPCGSSAMYSDCCEPLHKGQKAATTAVELMRSRYTAFCYQKIDYIISTTLPDRRTEKMRDDIRTTCGAVAWLELEIISTFQGGSKDKTGRVEFKASYVDKGQVKVHHERSHFSRKAGKWYYANGIFNP